MSGRGEGPRIQVMVRLPESLVKEYRHLAVDLRVTQGEAMAILLREALDARAALARKDVTRG